MRLISEIGDATLVNCRTAIVDTGNRADRQIFRQLMTREKLAVPQTGQNEAPTYRNCGHSTPRADGAAAASGWPIRVLEGARTSPKKARMAAGRGRESETDMNERRANFEYEDLIACARGELFGPGNPQLPLPPLLMFDQITDVSEQGGANGKGVILAEFSVKPGPLVFRVPFQGRSGDAWLPRARRALAASWFLSRLAWPRLDAAGRSAWARSNFPIRSCPPSNVSSTGWI